MSQSATVGYRFAGSAPLPLAARFAGGRLPSDGGLPWLAAADAALGLCAAFAAIIPEWRRGPVRHCLPPRVRQRVFQIARGAADQDAADFRRSDPLRQLVGGQLPATGRDLASQPTLARLAHAVDRTSCQRLAVALGDRDRRERERDGVPPHIVLDRDGTDDPTPGQQAGSASHGYSRQHMLPPLLVCAGDTHQRSTAVPRRGTTHGSTGVVAGLKRVVAALRARWPHVTIEPRRDSGGAVPASSAFGDQEGSASTIGLVTTPRLTALAAPRAMEARRHRVATGGEQVRLRGAVSQQAERWEHPRRVSSKAEALPKGPKTRCVGTTRTAPPAALCDGSVARGASAHASQDLQNAGFADRLRDHRFWATPFRLLLPAAASWLLDTLRRWLAARPVARLPLATPRLALRKIGGRVAHLRDRVRLRLASSHPGHPLWAALAAHQRLHE